MRRNPRRRVVSRGKSKPQWTLLAAIALVSAVITLMLSGQVQSRRSDLQIEQKNPVVVGEFDVTDVFVPVRPVAKGTQLEKVQFRKVKYPAHQVPDGALRDPQSYLAYYTIANLPAGLPVHKANLSAERMGSNPVAERIPEGMRAMTVKVDPTSLVNGWAGPGSSVDVALLTSERSLVIAEKIRILSTEKFVAQVEGAPSQGLPTTATILVDQRQALAISAAMPHGKLIFLLRNSSDAGQWNSKQLQVDQLHRVSKTKNFKGFISVRSGKAFALEEKGWIPVSKAPDGALVGE